MYENKHFTDGTLHTSQRSKKVNSAEYSVGAISLYVTLSFSASVLSLCLLSAIVRHHAKSGENKVMIRGRNQRSPQVVKCQQRISSSFIYYLQSPSLVC